MMARKIIIKQQSYQPHSEETYELTDTLGPNFHYFTFFSHDFADHLGAVIIRTFSYTLSLARKCLIAQPITSLILSDEYRHASNTFWARLTYLLSSRKQCFFSHSPALSSMSWPVPNVSRWRCRRPKPFSPVDQRCRHSRIQGASK